MTLGQCRDFSSDSNEVIRRVLVDGNIHREINRNDTMAKSFFFSRGFQSTDQGNHRGHVDNDMQFGSAKETAENLHQRYILTNISLYHYPTPSYTGYINKIVRAVNAYGFDSLNNCSKVQRGVHYCDAFVNHFDRKNLVCSRDTYIGMTGCGRQMERAYRNDRFKYIFIIYAKSLAELVGA